MQQKKKKSLNLNTVNEFILNGLLKSNGRGNCQIYIQVYTESMFYEHNMNNVVI